MSVFEKNKNIVLHQKNICKHKFNKKKSSRYSTDHGTFCKLDKNP